MTAPAKLPPPPPAPPAVLDGGFTDPAWQRWFSLVRDTLEATRTGAEYTSNKNQPSGYAGLGSTYQIQFKNAAGTFTSTLANTNTAARVYTFPNETGTVELTLHKSAASGYAGLSASYQVQCPNTAGSVVSLLSNAATGVRTWTFPDESGTVELTAHRDAASGYAALGASYEVHSLNAAGTYVSLLTNTNTAARTYTFPDRSDTVVLQGDSVNFNACGVQAFGSATSALIGTTFACNGQSLQGPATLNADSTDLPTVIALANQLRAMAIAFGFGV